jgi:plastocyanin
VRIARLSAVAFVLALTACGAGSTTPKRLTGTVGPGFTISLSATEVKAGRYLITVEDRSSLLDFHLTGPGVDEATGTAAVKTYRWTVTLQKGTYRFVCDPHRTVMQGTLKVT